LIHIRKNALLQLTKNELNKFYSHRVTFYLLIALFVLVFYFATINYSLSERVQDNSWKDRLADEIIHQESLIHSNVPNIDAAIIVISHEQEINKYMFDNNIMPVKTHSIASLVLTINRVFAIVVITSIVSVVQIISSDYSEAITDFPSKLPCKRWKILTSKIITLVIMCISIMADRVYYATSSERDCIYMRECSDTLYGNADCHLFR
jgi:ABC-type transport system involved in multi-copper enzyme maturation permease subunit